MKIAILFTGALRTIKKTMRYFKQNLLLNSDVDVFACLQNDTQESNESIESWLYQEIGSHLKNLQWFNISEHSDWNSLRNKQLSNLYLVEHWKNYLKTSGSMIEYYQLYLAYQKMCYYEDTHQRYKYIIRSRTDTIFAKPIDFHWLNLSDSQINDRIILINEELHLSDIEITPLNTLKYFMSTIISDQIIPNIQNIIPNYIPNNRPEIPQTPSEFNTYIKNGSYILTLRANNLYIINRELFNFLPTLCFAYGYLKSPHRDDYWFNAEGQFQAACYFSGLTVFDYNTNFEDKSLYEYDEKRYFDLNYNILNPYMMYSVIRH